MPMDPKIKAEWLTGLRSGEYKQAHGSLQVTGTGEYDGYCCLGVLCKVAGLEIDPTTDNTVVVVDGENGYGPISDLIGNPMVMTDLYYRNDGCQTYHRHTFAEIADVIEASL